MGFLDRFFGEKSAPPQLGPRHSSPGTPDEQAVARYRYLLRTAPPEAIEQAHAEAFEQLTPEQRKLALRELSGALPPSESAGASEADPQSLARLATRAELRQPGTLERVLGRGGAAGVGMGGMFAGTLLSSIAGTFIGTAIAHQFLGGFHGGGDDIAHAAGGDGAEAADEPVDLGDDDLDVGDDDFGGFGDA